MSRRFQENIAAAAILLILLGVLYVSSSFGPRARMVPIPVAIFGIIMMVIQIVWQNVRPAEELHVDLLDVLTKRGSSPGTKASSNTPDDKSATGSAPSWRKEAIALTMIVFFTAMVFLAGPVPAIFVFTCGYFILSGHYSWGRALVYTAIFTASIYLLFVVALEIQLYHGLLEPIFRRS